MMFYICLFLILPCIIGIVMYTRMMGTIHNYMETQVTAQVNILRGVASRRFAVPVTDLERVANYFKDGAVPEEEMGEMAGELLQQPSQTSYGILRLDGTSVCGEALDTAEYPTIMAAFRGRETMRYRENEGILFAVPIYNNGNIKYVLYEFFDAKTLFEHFADYCYDGNYDLLLADGKQMLTLTISKMHTVTQEYFHEKSTQEAFAELGQQMRESTSATVYCRSENRSDFVFLSEIGRSNLFLLGFIPHDLVAEGIEQMLPLVIAVFALLLALLTFGLIRVVTADAQLRESDELRAAKEAAEEAARSKGQFLASMSHELRTPINTIVGLNELTLRETSETTTKEHSMDIKSAAQILVGLISDVLDFSKIESGQLSVIPVEYNLASLIRDLVLLSENRARAKSLEFQVEVQQDLPVGLFGDDTRIQQVLANLLTNAVKYTPEGSVLLRITGSRTEEDMVRLHCEVIDTGIGIKEEDIPLLVLPFHRADEERNRNIEGSGLGLSIVTHLLELMDSHLEVDSVYGSGSTFYFDLDQKVVDPEPIGDIRKRISDMVKDYEYRVSCIASEAKILMVDDNAMNRKIFVSLLKPTQISVTTVSSGQKCLDIVQKEHFDLIFMDHLMPGMDGVETLCNLRELEGNLCKDTPVIALTANAFSGAKERYMQLGFDDFLSKPIETEKLEAMIRQMLPKEYLQAIPEPEPEAKAASSSEVNPQPKPEEEPELPMLEGVHWDFARLHIHNTELLMDALRDFNRNIDNEYKEISNMAENVETEDGLTTYRIRVHALKSTSATVGILSVSEIARLLEAAARAGEVDRIRTLNPVLLEELMATKERLLPIAVEEKEKQELGDSSELLAMLETLRADMEAMDIGKADSDMGRLNSFNYAPEIQELVDQIAGLAASLDYEGANEAVAKLVALVSNAPAEE